MNFGERLRSLRKDIDYSLRKMADELGISYSALGKYERNEHQPDFETLEKIADYFNVSIDWLLGREQIHDGYNHALEIIDNAVKNMNPDAEFYIPPLILNDMIENKVDESQLSVIPVFESKGAHLDLNKTNIIKYELKYSSEMSADEFFYIIVPDDSMKGANIVKNSKVLCRKLSLNNKDDLDNGKIYFVSHKGTFYIRRVFINDQKQMTLQAENIQFPPIIIQNNVDVNIVGQIQSVEFNPNEQ